VIIVRADFHDRRGPSWQLIAGALLAGLLIALAVLQYRWLGAVGEAERARMRAGLQTRASDFTQEFDRELTRIYLAFDFDPDALDKDAARAIGAGFENAQSIVAPPGVIRDVFLLEVQGPQASVLQRFDAATRTLQTAEWPPALAAWRERASRSRPLARPAGLPIFMADAVDASAPALIVPIPFVRKIDDGAGHVAVVSNPGAPARSLIVWLDADRLRQQLLEPLVAKYFGDAGASEYLVSIVGRDQPSHVVYSSSSQVVDERGADVSAGLFDLRLDEMTRMTGLVKDHAEGAPPTVRDRVAITIVRRAGSAGDASHLLMAGGANQGAWQLRARYRSGSLEAIVTSSRRRNMAITLAILGLLGAASGLVIAASQRQRRLAQQQMEFVASVSHELRTPLAVICSAGENLADGVVADSAQVKTYGSLIETEGRRLGDMVERVLLFAGIGSGTHTRARIEVDLARVLADAVAGVAADARDRGVAINVHPVGPLPTLLGDGEAIRSALQNVVGNAVKYSADGGSVDVTMESLQDAIVRIRMADRGMGIDAADLPHIFQPFYRGRRALDSQVRGSGIGLSVVMHVVRMHGGDVQVESRAGEGTTVTIVLPGAARPDSQEDSERAVRLRGHQAGASS
jgi:signal transduction histidine kinase